MRREAVKGTFLLLLATCLSLLLGCAKPTAQAPRAPEVNATRERGPYSLDTPAKVGTRELSVTKVRVKPPNEASNRYIHSEPPDLAGSGFRFLDVTLTVHDLTMDQHALLGTTPQSLHVVAHTSLVADGKTIPLRSAPTEWAQEDPSRLNHLLEFEVPEGLRSAELRVTLSRDTSDTLLFKVR